MKKHLWLMLAVSALVFIAALPLSAVAKDEWIQAHTKNFNLVGNASEKDIRKVATRLEQFRETFRLLFSQINFTAPISTNVVVFKSVGAYKPFLPRRADGKADTGIAGYFQPGEDVNYITLSTEGEDDETFGTIFHEYVHFMVNTNFGKSEVPPWFNEGLAEYYQTFAIDDDQKVKLGLPQSVHLQLLQQSKLIPLDTLFSVSNYALHQNGNHSRSIFYAESWALIHYLIQSGKTEGLGKFLNLAIKDVPAEKNFQDSFQMTYAQMEKELKKYVAQNSYKYQLITLKNKLTFDGEMQVSPLSEADANAYLGDLLYHTNRADDAEPYLQKAIALAPDSSMANTTFGMVKIRQRKFSEAKNYLEKAVASDRTNHLAFYNYAYLLSREDRDEFGYVRSFPAEKASKMREMLKKAVAVKPDFTESYELLAFVDLVNNEQLDEAVGYLQKALRYQPGNQQYSMRIAEIYMRQDKFAEAQAIADKIAKTADEPRLKSQAENLVGEIRQRQEMIAQNENARRQYEAGQSQENAGNGQLRLVRRAASGAKIPTPEQAAKIEAAEKLRALNQALRKPKDDEKQILGQIQKIECKGKNVFYTVNSAGETFTLSSKDFQNLTLTTYVADNENVEIGCGAKVADLTLVLTYKPQTDAKTGNRGELGVIEFVPKTFRLMTAAELESEPEETRTETVAPSSATAENSDEQRRAAMTQWIRNALRQPEAGEKRELGFIQKVECSSKGMFFYFKTATQTLKINAASPQAIKIRAFTKDVKQSQFGCGMKPMDIPAVFVYRENTDAKNNADGEIVSLEFVPKNFSLEK